MYVHGVNKHTRTQASKQTNKHKTDMISVLQTGTGWNLWMCRHLLVGMWHNLALLQPVQNFCHYIRRFGALQRSSLVLFCCHPLVKLWYWFFLQCMILWGPWLCCPSYALNRCFNCAPLCSCNQCQRCAGEGIRDQLNCEYCHKTNINVFSDNVLEPHHLFICLYSAQNVFIFSSLALYL